MKYTLAFSMFVFFMSFAHLANAQAKAVSAKPVSATALANAGVVKMNGDMVAAKDNYYYIKDASGKTIQTVTPGTSFARAAGGGKGKTWNCVKIKCPVDFANNQGNIACWECR